MNSESTGPALSSFFTSPDGRWSGRFARDKVARGGRVDVRSVVLVSIAITWLPLLLLSIVNGVAWGGGTGVPFLRDFLPYGQFLLAVPALLIADWIVPQRLNQAAAELRRAGVVAEQDLPELESSLAGAAGAWGGRWVNGAIFLITIGATIASLAEAREWLTGSWQIAGEDLSLAGWWYLLVSLPLLRFLEVRWIWRLLVWARFLWRTSSLELEPRPSHPDRAGGLAYLGEAQLAFGWLVFALGVQLSCLIADRVFFRDANLAASGSYVAAFVLLTLLALFLPLLAFTPTLARARYEGILFLSSRGFGGAGALDARLEASRGALPESDVSGLADYGALLDNARLMRPVPFEARHILVLGLIALLPFLPLVFLVMPAREVLQTLAHLLL